MPSSIDSSNSLAFDFVQVTAVIDNNMSQLDSSVYTQIFIPSEGELNSAAVKYQQQVSGV